MRLWDLSTGRLISERELGALNRMDARRSVVRTRDRRHIAINVQSNVVQVLDADSGAWLQPPITVPTEIVRLVVSADGRLLAIASASRVFLYKAGSDEPLFSPVELSSPPYDICFSDDARWLACQTRNTIWLMNTVTGGTEPEFSSSALRITFLGTSGRLIITSPGPLGPLGLVDGHTGKDLGSPFGQPEFDARRHGDLLFSHRELQRWISSTMRLLDPTTGSFQAEPFTHDGPFLATWLRPDGRVAATASQDRTVRLWSVEMHQALPLTLPAGHEVRAWEAQWSPSGDRIFSTSGTVGNSQMRLWDARTGVALGPPAHLEDVAYFGQWSPDGTRIVTAAETGAVIWDAQTGRALCAPLRHGSGRLVHCAFSPSGEVLATAAEDHTVRLWNGRTGEAIGDPLIHSDTPLKISFSSDGRRLATGSADGTIRIWSVPEGKLVLGPLHHSGICWVAAFSPDNRWLVSASSDRTAQLWDAATGKPALPPFRHEGAVYWVSFSPDGRAIATSTQSGTARVWDAATGQLLSEPMRHPDDVWFVKWSADGRFLATTCVDGSARVWDAFTGHLVAEPFVHDRENRRAEFSPDGQQLLTAGYDGAIEVWDLPFLRPPLPVPDWLPALAESLGGKRLGPRDSLESVPGDSFQIAKARIEQWGNKDYYGRWARWLLQERFEHPVKPFHP